MELIAITMEQVQDAIKTGGGAFKGIKTLYVLPLSVRKRRRDSQQPNAGTPTQKVKLGESASTPLTLTAKASAAPGPPKKPIGKAKSTGESSANTLSCVATVIQGSCCIYHCWIGGFANRFGKLHSFRAMCT